MLSNGDSLSHSPRPDGKTGEPWLVRCLRPLR